MTGFEPGSSGIESDRAVNCATNHFCLSGSTQFEKASLENTHLLCKEKYHFLTRLDSAALFMFNQQQIYLFGQIQTRQTGCRPYSDTYPYEVMTLTSPLWEVLISNTTFQFRLLFMLSWFQSRRKPKTLLTLFVLSDYDVTSDRIYLNAWLRKSGTCMIHYHRSNYYFIPNEKPKGCLPIWCFKSKLQQFGAKSFIQLSD